MRAPRAARVALGLLVAVLGGALAVGVIPVGDSTDAGRARVGMALPVTATDLTIGLSNNSPLLVADPTEPRFVVLANRIDAPDFSCSLHLSGDGGRRWAPANPVPELPEGAEKCYAPEVAFDKRGGLYFLFVGLAGRGNEPTGAFLTTSTDRGRSFGPPRRVLGPLNFAVRMAIDPDVGRNGRLHLTWLHATSDPGVGAFGAPPNPILAAHSDDGGRTFSRPVEVSDADRERVVAPAMVLGHDHRVHVAYYDLRRDARDYQNLEGPVWEGEWSLIVATSSDDGETFDRGVVVDDGVVPFERVMLIFTMPPPALVTHEQGVCAAWSDARHGDADVLLRCSEDHGKTWTKPVRVNDDRVGNGLRQYLPRLATAPDGRVDIVFFDRRSDRQNVRNHLFYAFSTNGGKDFSPNRKITRYPSDSRIGQRYAGPGARDKFEIGSRLGLLSRSDGVVVAWPDARNHTPGTTNQDLFTTRVALPRPANAGWVRVLGGALVVTGAMGVLLNRKRRPTDVTDPSSTLPR